MFHVSLNFIISLAIFAVVNNALNGLSIPVQFESDCFVNLVFKNISRNHNIMLNNANTEDVYFNNFNFTIGHSLTYTVKQRGALVEVVDVVEITEDNIEINVKERYFRYQVRHRNPCILFILLTEDFNETTWAIHESGYGTSSNAVFLIHVSQMSKDNELIASFQNFLFSSDWDWEHAFHASVVFFDDSSTLGVYCYFCPNTSEQIHTFNEPTEPLPLKTIITTGDLLNQNGHGRRLKLVEGPEYLWLVLPKCLSPFLDKRENHRRLYDALRTCAMQATVISTLQDILNITLVLPNATVSEQEKREMEWFLHLHFAEGAMRYIPNVYLFTRGSYILQMENSLNMIACRNYHSMSGLDFYFRTILDAPTWLAVISLAFAYAYTFMDSSLAVHFIWLFLGVHNTSRHSRKQTGFIVLSVATLGYVFQGYINTDAMYVTKFPRILDLAKMNYRIWLWPRDTKRMIETAMSTFGNRTQKKYQPVLDAARGNIRNILHDESDSDYVNPEKSNFPTIVEMLSKRNLIAPGQDFAALRSRIGNGVKNVESGTYLCLVADVREEFDSGLEINLGFRVYGYMERRASWAISKWLQMGFFHHWKRFSNFLSRASKNNSLDVADADTFLEPKSVGIKSEIGVSIVYLIIIQFILILFTWRGTLLGDCVGVGKMKCARLWNRLLSRGHSHHGSEILIFSEIFSAVRELLSN